MDILPGASLELRIYVLLGIVGVMFFGAILALAVGRFLSVKSSSKIDSLADESPFGKKTKPVKEKKEKTPKKVKTPTSVDDLIVDEPVAKRSKTKEEKPQKHFFGKKKVDAVQLLAAPSGYEEEYAPTSTRNFDSEIPSVVEYVEEEPIYAEEVEDQPALQDYVEASVAFEESSNSYDDLDGWDAPESQPVSSEEDKKRKQNDSPFGGDDDWDF